MLVINLKKKRHYLLHRQLRKSALGRIIFQRGPFRISSGVFLNSGSVKFSLETSSIQSVG